MHVDPAGFAILKTELGETKMNITSINDVCFDKQGVVSACGRSKLVVYTSPFAYVITCKACKESNEYKRAYSASLN